MTHNQEMKLAERPKLGKNLFGCSEKTFSHPLPHLHKLIFSKDSNLQAGEQF